MNTSMLSAMSKAKTASRSLRRGAAGVSLIELLVVVTIIGILGMIAVPSYRSYTMRAHRTEAKNALLQIATSQERYYLQNNSYGTLAQLAAANYPTTTEYGIYTLTLATVAGWRQDFTATATVNPAGGTNGVNQSADTDCATFTINSRGVRNATPNPQGNCW